MKKMVELAAASVRHAWLRRNPSTVQEANPEQKLRRLFVDVSTIIRHDARTGIQRVVRAVWSELSSRSGEHFLVQPVFATRTRGYCCAPADFLNGVGRDWVAEPMNVSAGDQFLGLDLAAHLLPGHRRQLVEWKSLGASIHLLVYDLLPLMHPEWFNPRTASNFRKWLSILATHADQAICISDNVAHCLERCLADGCKEGPQIVRMQMGGDISASIPSVGVSREISGLLELARFRPAILMVGTIEPRKAYDVALDAFELLWRTRPDAPDLIIVGKPGWKTSSIQSRLKRHPYRGSRLHWLARTSDEALCGLYKVSAGVFVPSRAEGFGLPLIEAAQFRRYVLARDLPVFREHRLTNTVFFEDDSPAALADRLVELARIGRAGLATATALPTWGECVDGLLDHLGLGANAGRSGVSPLRQAS